MNGKMKKNEWENEEVTWDVTPVLKAVLSMLALREVWKPIETVG